MANAVVSRLGQDNLTGVTDALFLKMYAGEVLTAFRENNVFKARTLQRTITSGKSAQFPATGKADSEYHTPGAEILGDAMAHSERVIVIDDELISSKFIASVDEAKNHYDVRSEYSFQSGAALARAYDRNVAQVLALAARASATVTGGNGGTQLLAGTDVTTDASVLIDAAFAAAEALDEKDVPDTDRTLALSPSLYYLLINSGSRAIDVDYNPGGNGSIASGKIYHIAGMQIVKTNNIPSTEITTGPVAYQGDFTATKALAFHRSAVGTVQLRDLSLDMDWDFRRRGHLIVAAYLLGHGILRPESAVEITDTVAP